MSFDDTDDWDNVTVMECDCTVILTSYPYTHCPQARKTFGHADFTNVLIKDEYCLRNVDWKKYAESKGKKFRDDRNI